MRSQSLLMVLPLLLVGVRSLAAADDPVSSQFVSMVVGDIKIEGLRRISEGTVYNYLPVNIGDSVDSRRVRESIVALYKTGLFRDVEMRRDGGVLIVVVQERPVIERFEISGNKDIKTEDLQRSLANVGLAQGKPFDRSILEEVQQYLTDQYYARGKYGTQVTTRVEETQNDQVVIEVDIHEGRQVRIRQINIVGNAAFEDEQLLGELQLGASHWLSWYQQNDRYSRESMNADLERLRSYYMDRGYADFQISSTQVSLSPQKDDLFITINVTEGQHYRVSQVKLGGASPQAAGDLSALLMVAPGDVYSQRTLTASIEAIKYRLGQHGYAFADVEMMKTATGDELALTLMVDAGQRAYVRRINFLGSSAINDVVLRRELRQLEGAYLSNLAVERSKQRIQRLPYVEEVEVQTSPVAGATDLVDVDFTVKEGLPGQFGGSIGYSQSQAFILSGNMVHSNFLGTGERVAVDASGSKYSKLYQLSHTDPYATLNGVSRSLSLSYSDVNQLTSSYSDLSTKTYSLGVEYAYPITENQSLSFGASLQHWDMLTSLGSSTQLQDWVKNNGSGSFRNIEGYYLLGTQADVLELSAGWWYDSRDRVLFPRFGAQHRLSLSTAAPLGDIQYAVANYRYEQFFGLPMPWLDDGLRFRFNARLSHARALGDTTALPPNRLSFMGGPDSVRGFKESTLGPRDSLGNPYGGDTAVAAQLEAIMPLPEKFSRSARLSLFVDAGQTYYQGDTEFEDRAGLRADHSFRLDAVRVSTGIAVEWLAPMGLFRFSYAQPLRYQEQTWRLYGDQLERFQFSIGSAF